MKIMVVDDSITFQLLMSRELEAILGEGHEILKIKTGAMAITTYSKFLPDFVTMDVVMGSVDGIEASRRIGEKHPDAKILVVTSHKQEEARTKEIDVIKGFIVKPIDRDELKAALRNIKVL